jgi:3'-5' exoribonuclease
MKTQFLSSVKAGESISDVFILAEKSMAQKRDGDYFLTVTIADRSGKIKGVVWDHADDIHANVHTGDVVHVEGNVNEYKGTLQIVVRQMTPCPADAVDPADFVPSTARDVEGMFERLVEITGGLEQAHLTALFKAFWDDDAFVRSFKLAPAAKKMHHAYLGGLLEHTLSMVALADKIAKHYSGIDRDMLIAGTVLHDIGKVREFDYRLNIDYSDEGRLLSHIVIGIQMLDDKLKQLKGFPEELAFLLKHMIVSHHGTREFGSPEPPKTVEAVLLNYIDEIDSKVNGIREFIAKEDSEESWTSYHRLWERHFYRGTQAG